MPKFSSCLVVVCTFILSGCSVDFRYPTVVLPQDFEATAERIEVKEPVRQYKTSFYNISLGEYNIEDTFVSKVSKRKLSNQPEGRVTKDNTLWNILLKRTLDFEKVTYEQYRVEETNGFGFSMESPEAGTIKSQCSKSVIGLDNHEVGRSSLRFEEVDENEGYVEVYGEWLATRLSCNLQHERGVWVVTSTQTIDSLPTVSIEGGGKAYSVKILRESISDEPGRGGRVENTHDSLIIFNYSLPGLGVFQQGRQIAAVSLIQGNNWIWISSTLAETEKALLVSAFHSLILNSWITG